MQYTIKDLSTPFQPLTNGIFSLETNFVSYIIKQEIKEKKMLWITLKRTCAKILLL